MNNEAANYKTAIVTAWIALVGAVIAAIFSAYTTIVVSNEKHSVERAELFTKLIHGLGSSEGSESRLALLNLWQLYPDDHKVIVLASLEIGHSELVETMIRLDDEVKPYQGFLLVQAKSKNPDVAMSAKRIIEQLDPEAAAKIYVDELMATSDIPIGNEKIEKLIALVEAYPDVKDVIESKIGGPNSAILEYVLYRSLADMSWLDVAMTASRIDELSDVLCCGKFDAKDQSKIAEVVLKSVEDFGDSNKYAVSHVANFLNNPSLQSDRMSANLDDVVNFGRTVVDSDDFYYQARANALRALAKWSPADALQVIADRLAVGETNEFIKLEMTELLNDSSFISRAAVGIGLRVDDLENIPKVDDNSDTWEQWRDTTLAPAV